MHVLVIGGTRFVGYLLTWRLLAGGHPVTLFNRGTLPDPFGNRVERLTGDRTNPDFGHLLVGRRFDACVDLAAYTEKDARQVIDVLGQGAVGHYIFISSGQVYLVRRPAPRPARESDYDGPLIPQPSDPAEWKEWDYGMGKRRAEDVLADAWRRERFPCTRLRIPMVNGERDYYRRVESYLWRILDGGPVILPDGGRQPTRHVYGWDVAAAICGMLGSTATFGQAYNLCQDDTPTLAELVGQMSRLLGAPDRSVAIQRGQIENAGLLPQEISPFSTAWMSFLEPTKAKVELGFNAERAASYLPKIVMAFLAAPPAAPPENYQYRAAEVSLAARLS